MIKNRIVKLSIITIVIIINIIIIITLVINLRFHINEIKNKNISLEKTQDINSDRNFENYIEYGNENLNNHSISNNNISKDSPIFLNLSIILKIILIVTGSFLIILSCIILKKLKNNI